MKTGSYQKYYKKASLEDLKDGAHYITYVDSSSAIFILKYVNNQFKLLYIQERSDYSSYLDHIWQKCEPRFYSKERMSLYFENDSCALFEINIFDYISEDEYNEDVILTDIL